MNDTRPRWKGYETVKWYWQSPDDQDAYIVWARDDKEVRNGFQWWLRWLPCPVLFRIQVWMLTH